MKKHFELFKMVRNLNRANFVSIYVIYSILLINALSLETLTNNSVSYAIEDYEDTQVTQIEMSSSYSIEIDEFKPEPEVNYTSISQILFQNTTKASNKPLPYMINSTRSIQIIESNNTNQAYFFLFIIFGVLVLFLLLLLNKCCLLFLIHFCSCTKNDSICLFLNYAYDVTNQESSGNEKEIKKYTESENYSMIVKANKSIIPYVNDIKRSTNLDICYYGNVNEDSEDGTMPRIVHKQFIQENGNATTSSDNNSKLESFRLGSFTNQYSKVVNKKRHHQSENGEHFYLDIYNSFANLNVKLNETLCVEDDPLNEFDKIQKTLSKSVCELNQLHKSIECSIEVNEVEQFDQENKKDLERKAEFYYQEIENEVLNESLTENCEKASDIFVSNESKTDENNEN